MGVKKGRFRWYRCTRRLLEYKVIETDVRLGKNYVIVGGGIGGGEGGTAYTRVGWSTKYDKRSLRDQTNMEASLSGHPSGWKLLG